MLESRGAREVGWTRWHGRDRFARRRCSRPGAAVLWTAGDEALWTGIISTHGVSLGVGQISGPGSSGFNCQLEQVPEMSQTSSASQPAPLLSAVHCPPLLPGLGMLLPFSGPPGHHDVVFFCSPACLSHDKHGHSLRTSKSSTVWQLPTPQRLQGEDTGKADPRGREVPPKGHWLHRAHPTSLEPECL